MMFFTFTVSLFVGLALGAVADPSPNSPFWFKSQAIAVGEAPGAGEHAETYPDTCTATGKFPLQSNCTHFVYCNDELSASILPCPACDPNDAKWCPAGLWHFDTESSECMWPENAKCGPQPTTTTTPKPEIPGECEPGCKQEGTCMCYDTCERDNSSSTGYSWVRRWCPQRDPSQPEKGLFWNPDTAEWPHGGSCDYWENLSPAVQAYYESLGWDECPTPGECKWEEHDSCDNWYYYLPPGVSNPSLRLELRCAKNPADGQPLWWSQTALTCVPNCPRPGGCRFCP